MTKVLNNDVNASPLSCFLKTEKTPKISLQNVTADRYSPSLMISVIIVAEWIYWPVAPSDDQFPCWAVTTDKLHLAVYIYRIYMNRLRSKYWERRILVLKPCKGSHASAMCQKTPAHKALLLLWDSQFAPKVKPLAAVCFFLRSPLLLKTFQY